MNLQRARYLIALSDHGSFTRAAANVHVAQSALSQQIKVLERELGVPLVDRRGPQFTFTEAGKVAVREARFLIGCADRAVERIRLAARGVDGELRIAYTRSWAGGAVADLVSTYRRLYPASKLSFIVALRRRLSTSSEPEPSTSRLFARRSMKTIENFP